MHAERQHFPARGAVKSSPSSSLLLLLTLPASTSSTSGSRDLEASRCSFSLRILLLGFSQLLLWSVKPLRPACATCSVWGVSVLAECAADQRAVSSWADLWCGSAACSFAIVWLGHFGCTASS